MIQALYRCFVIIFIILPTVTYFYMEKRWDEQDIHLMLSNTMPAGQIRLHSALHIAEKTSGEGK